MNQRQQRKIQKQRNNEQLDQITEALASVFQLQEAFRLDGCEDYYWGEHSTFEFRIAECPNWKWGILLLDKKESFTFFGQHDELYQVFLPEHCHYQFTYESLEIGIPQVLKFLTSVSTDPLAAFAKSLRKRKTLKKGEAEKICEVYQAQKQAEYQADKQAQADILDYCRMLKYRYSPIVGVGLIDEQTLNATVYPRYALYLEVEEMLDPWEEEKLCSQITQELANSIYESPNYSIGVAKVVTADRWADEYTYQF